MPFCDVIIYSYHYLLDPKIAERVSREFSKDCIVVFDEAHNIDNVCIESLSIDITEDSLRKASRGADNLERSITQMKSTDAEKLQNEYSKLVEGLREADESRQEDAFMANPGQMPNSIFGDLDLIQNSPTRRLAQRSNTREHSKSGTFRCISQTICRISQGRSVR